VGCILWICYRNYVNYRWTDKEDAKEGNGWERQKKAMKDKKGWNVFFLTLEE
jgi:hypothetical protein